MEGGLRGVFASFRGGCEKLCAGAAFCLALVCLFLRVQWVCQLPSLGHRSPKVPGWPRWGGPPPPTASARPGGSPRPCPPGTAWCTAQDWTLAPRGPRPAQAACSPATALHPRPRPCAGRPGCVRRMSLHPGCVPPGSSCLPVCPSVLLEVTCFQSAVSTCQLRVESSSRKPESPKLLPGALCGKRLTT